MLDLDDTTVPHGKLTAPSARVLEAITKAKEKIHVCIATGRPLDITLPLIDHMSLSGPCIVNNGTVIYDPVAKQVVREIFLEPESIPAIYDVCRKNSLFVVAHNRKKEAEYTGEPLEENIIGMYIPQIVSEKVDAIVDALAHIPHIAAHKLTGWDKNFLSIEVTHSDASKQHGVLEVSRILGLKTEEIIGVGDGYNDFSLLMACGLRIAMGNAVPELKAIADFIAPSIDEDGVAVVIEKFVLGQ